MPKREALIYTPLPELTATIDIADLLKRLSHAVKHEPEVAEVEAVMGAVPPVSDSIREAFTFYCDKLAVSELANKSPDHLAQSVGEGWIYQTQAATD